MKSLVLIALMMAGTLAAQDTPTPAPTVKGKDMAQTAAPLKVPVPPIPPAPSTQVDVTNADIAARAIYSAARADKLQAKLDEMTAYIKMLSDRLKACETPKPPSPAR